MVIQHFDGETLRELRVVMGEDFAKLLQTFASDSAARVVAIRETAAAADAEGLRRAAHSFKGSAGNMGALRLSDLCRQIEEFARDGVVDSCLPLIDMLVDEFRSVQDELEQLPH